MRVLSSREHDRSINLMEHEFEALLAALRRDYHQEQFNCVCGGEERGMHGCNARMDLRLLEILQPKTARAIVVAAAKTEVVAAGVNVVTKTVEVGMPLTLNVEQTESVDEGITTKRCD